MKKRTRITTHGKTRNLHRSAGSSRGRRPKKLADSPAVIGASIVLTVIVVVAAIGLPAARQQSRQPDVAVAEPQATATEAAAKIATPVPEMKKIEAKKIAPATTASPAPVTVATDAPTAPNLPSKELAATTVAVAPASTAKSDTQASAAVTVVGCLEASDSGFRLEDTSGVDVPKARSWKSGFLRKRTPPLELEDAAGTLRLSTHVGQRVSATGTFVGRTMRAQSMQSVSPSCR